MTVKMFAYLSFATAPKIDADLDRIRLGRPTSARLKDNNHAEFMPNTSKQFVYFMFWLRLDLAREMVFHSSQLLSFVS